MPGRPPVKFSMAALRYLDSCSSVVVDCLRNEHDGLASGLSSGVSLGDGLYVLYVCSHRSYYSVAPDGSCIVISRMLPDDTVDELLR